MRQRDRECRGYAIVSSLLSPAFSFCCSAIDDSITSAKESRAREGRRGGEREEREDSRDKAASSCW